MAEQVTWPDLYPVFLRLQDAPVLVVGAGSVGTRKVGRLVSSGARVTVVAPVATDEVQKLARQEDLTWREREFEEGDVEGVVLVFAATPSREVNEQVARAGAGRGIWVNVADTPDLCSFYLPSLVDRHPLRIAVSTSGACPAYARDLRKRLQQQYPPSTSGFVDLLGRMREDLRERAPGEMMRRSNDMVQSDAESRWAEGDVEQAREILKDIVERR